ncbi:MAG: WYL domain-containing protein, partial [Oscillospiraceae bacterium]
MELFNEIKNLYFRALSEAVHRILTASPDNRGERSISKAEFESLISEYAPYNQTIMDELLYESRIFEVYSPNSSDPKGQKKPARVKLNIEAEVPIIPSEAEQRWLLTVLERPEARLFLSEEEMSSIKSVLGESAAPIPQEFFAGSDNPGDELSDEYVQKFRLLLNAIHNGKLLTYTNTTGRGEVLEGKQSYPGAVEYSMYDRKLRLAHYSADELRPLKSNISRLSGLEISEPSERFGKSVKEIVEERLVSEKLKFTVFDRNNAVDRALTLFSDHDRTITENGDGSVTFEISYYTFQESDLKARILSFGAKLVVESPDSFVSWIKE